MMNIQTKMPRPDFLTFSELANRWNCSAEYLHDLIRMGRIVPAIALTDQERYVGGEFCGGYLVGDIENARHRSYAEYYVGSVADGDDHHENRPQCGRIVFCHVPTDEPGGGYSFQFVSESAAPGQTDQWFYLDHGTRISSVDEGRFRFMWSEIDRFEAEGVLWGGDEEHPLGTERMSSTAEAPSPQRPSDEAGVQHILINRVHVLEAEIEEAQTRALNADDVSSVWAEFVKLAESKVGCLVGVGDGEVKYEREGEIAYFKKKNLRDRMRRAKAR